MRGILLTVCAAWLLVTGTVAAAKDVDMKKLIGAVSSKDKQACLRAIDELGNLGADASPAVDALIAALVNPDVEVCWHAARTLGSIGRGARAAVPALTKALSNDSPSVRAYAAFALGRIGRAAEPAVDGLTEIAFDKDAMVRRAAMQAILRIDPPIEKTMPLVLKVLEQGDMSVIMPALNSLAEEGKDSVDRLQRILADQKYRKAHYWVCLVLAEIGPDAQPAVPQLMGVIKHEDPDVRLQALTTLGEIGEGAKPAVPAILAAFENDKFEPVRYAAAYALGKIKAKGASEKALRQGLESSDEFLRTICAWGLARMNPDDKETVRRAVQMIVDAFKSDDVDVRRAAARAVVEFDVDPEIIAPALVDALKDKDPTVVASAIEALAGFGPKALQHIDTALKNKDLRHYAVQLVARVGPEAQSAVPSLIEGLGQRPRTEEDVRFVREAQFALAAIGPGAKKAVPVLIKALSDDHDEIRASAGYALGKIGPDARAAVPALRENLKSESPIVKLASIRALLEIQPGERRLAIVAAPLLMKALDSDYELVRAEAATALGEIGFASKPAIVRLEKLAENDESPSVREAAENALKKLKG